MLTLLLFTGQFLSKYIPISHHSCLHLRMTAWKLTQPFVLTLIYMILSVTNCIRGLLILTLSMLGIIFSRHIDVSFFFPRKQNFSHLMTKPTKLRVRPAKTPISLGIRTVLSFFACAQWLRTIAFFTRTAKPDQTLRMLMLGLRWTRVSFCQILCWGENK